MTESTTLLAPGVYSLEQIQTASATRNLLFPDKSLSPFKTSLGLADLGVNVDPNIREKRLGALRRLQSNEPFRPFLELLLNSVDYSKSINPDLQIKLSELKEGGWQIVIQDKPEGTGMTGEDFLNKYLDPYASGSAETRKTPSGNWKKGLMGVGAQQQISLLQNPADEIYISSAKDGEITVAKLEPNGDDVNITLGGVKNDKARVGVTQIIRLSGQTAQAIGFTPDKFGEYIEERLAAADGIDLSMDVAKIQPGQDEKSVVKQQLVSSRKDNLISTSNGETTVIVSKDKADESLVYLNVLGVRVGEAIKVKGKDLPKTIDLRFERPIETITEGRRATGLVKKDVEDLVSSIRNIRYAYFSSDEKENARIRLSVLSSLSPLYEKYEEANRWRNAKGFSIASTLKDTVKRVIGETTEKGIKVLPASLLNSINISNPEVILVGDQLLETSDIAKNLESAGFEKIDRLAPSVFKASFSSDEPVLVSSQGIIFVNAKVFDVIDDQALVKIRALLLNRAQWGKSQIVPKIVQKETIEPPWTKETVQDVVDIEETKQKQEIEEKSKAHYGKLKEDWEKLTYDEKRQRLNNWIKLMYVDNPVYKKPGWESDEITSDKQGYYHLSYLGGMFDEDNNMKLKYWHDLPEDELNYWFQAVSIALENKILDFAPTGEVYNTHLLHLFNHFPQSFKIGEAYVFQIRELAQTLTPGLTHGSSNKMNFLLNDKIYELFFQFKQPLNYHAAWWLDDNEINFIIEHASDLAKILGLTGEHANQFIEIFSNQEGRLRNLIDTLNKFERGTALLFSFPEEAVYLERLIQDYDVDVLKKIINKAVSNITRGMVLSPKVLYELVFPFVEKFPKLIDDPAPLSPIFFHKKPEPGWPAEGQLLWQILHNDFKLAISEDSPSKQEGVLNIDPALLPILKISGQESGFIQASDLSAFLNSTQFPADKLEVRRRELLHPILHLDQTPGNSYYELLKNSWQAIARNPSLPEERRKIEIKDFLSPGSKENTYYGFLICDYVGMDPREALFKLIVPGFGEGVHGLHFLTVLKDADFVQVTTANGSKKGTIFLESIKNGEGQVVDFKLNYEEENNADHFVGTDVRAWRKINPEQAQIEAALFRSKMQDFSSNIPSGRAEIRLNDVQINSQAFIYVQNQVDNLGTAEIKPKETGKTGVAVDDMPLTSFDLSSVIDQTNLPKLGKELLKKSGFLINITGCSQPITRDNNGFVNQKEVVELIVKLLESNVNNILTGMLKSGNIDFETVMPDEVWFDYIYTKDFIAKPTTPINLENKDDIAKWLLTAKAFKSDDGSSFSLADAIYFSINNIYSEEFIRRRLPEKVAERIYRKKVVIESEDDKEYDEPIPEDVEDFIQNITRKARQAFDLPAPGKEKLFIFMHRGKIRGMDSLAYYDSQLNAYSWHQSMLPKIKAAQAGDLNALAEIYEITVHECAHEKRRQVNEMFAHSAKFYQDVEAGILALKV